ncbi:MULTISPECIES: hypothetical protein [Sphingobium]|uniref:hypothetical protein n=1 Tax=Sphingobium TaxID=165695 RepID=UPI0015EBD3C6|nr:MULTISPECIES: hypothetical protein [Sphingobium]MCW2361604.1 hypothetical protein [Sphingobium sp. B10D3B]MCW2401717.1 hypothetical protein [Sphingobium sp. B10D7B]MCW2408696.1 hypothetical protein [Sphingobium xanthum]
MSFLIRALPHVLGVSAILGALWWLDNRGYVRGQADAERERMITAVMLTRSARETEQAIGEQINAASARYEQGRSALQATRTIIQPTVTKEIIREPRLSDPAAGLTDGLYREVNRARGAVGACASTPAGGIVCPLPGAGAADGQEHW